MTQSASAVAWSLCVGQQEVVSATRSGALADWPLAGEVPLCSSSPGPPQPSPANTLALPSPRPLTSPSPALAR